ncbi:AAA family ATPase [Paenibacillus lutimineralis]|uniref:AAA family ATPase n=1 Tax=Paenibacillus lutimineralis TaxID=2707005 RepID=UPI0013A6643E|nr:SMC family ATPase [Paenibacillus lutimineralis]
MKVSRLIINNFRVFHGHYVFDFSNKQLILVGGHNGHGKSSLFDAIQWCLTGEIRRYRGSSEYQNFNYLINETTLVEGGAKVEASVEVWLESDAMVHKIRRTLQKGPSKQTVELTIDDESCGVKKGAARICEILFLSNDEDTGIQQDMTQNLPSYFSATQLLSQDQLHEFILASNPKDRFVLMEKVLGLDKYGGEFGKYLLGSLQLIKEERSKASTDRQEIKESWVEVSTKLKEKEALLLKLGGITEEDLLKQLTGLAVQVKKSGADIPEILLSSVKIDNELLSRYRDVRQSINKHEDLCERILLLLQESRSHLDFTEDGYLTEQQKLKATLQRIYSRTSRRENGIVRAERNRSEFDSLIQKRIAYLEKQREADEVSRKAIEVEQQISAIVNNPQVLMAIEQYDSIDDFLAVYNKTNKDLSEIVTKIDIDKLSNISHQLQAKLNELTETFRQLETVKETTIKDREYVKGKLGVLTGEITSNKNNTIDQMIHDIQHFLLENTRDSCPVCGTDFQSSDKLRNAVRLTWEEASRQRSALEQEVVKLTGKKNELDREIVQTDAELARINTQTVELKNLYDENQLQIEKLRLSLKLWIHDLPLEQLSELKHTKDKVIQEHSIAYNLLLSLEDLQSELKRLSSERGVVINWMEEQKKLVGKRAHYLLGPEERLIIKIQTYDQYLLQARTQVEQIAQEGKETEGKLAISDHKWKERELKASEIKSLIPEFDILDPNIESWVRSFYQQKAEWGRLNATAEQLLEKVEAFLNKGEIADAKIEEKILSDLVNAKEIEIKHYEKLEAEIELLRERHNEIRSALMTDYLIDYSQSIDQLFMQISPHAIFKHVHLVPREGKLFVLMSEQSGDAAKWAKLPEDQLANKFNASLTFSSAQANVLAVCIFLSLALSQRWTALEMIGIDDPFQNMDDINVFSFIDVISQIISHKQVIISSHNEDFVNLIRNKSGLEAERIGYIHFKSYGRDRIDLETNCSTVS